MRTLKNKILVTIAIINALAFFVSVAMVDSVSSLPMIIASISGILLALFLIVNKEVLNV